MREKLIGHDGTNNGNSGLFDILALKSDGARVAEVRIMGVIAPTKDNASFSVAQKLFVAIENSLAVFDDEANLKTLVELLGG